MGLASIGTSTFGDFVVSEKRRRNRTYYEYRFTTLYYDATYETLTYVEPCLALHYVLTYFISEMEKVLGQYTCYRICLSGDDYVLSKHKELPASRVKLHLADLARWKTTIELVSRLLESSRDDEEISIMTGNCLDLIKNRISANFWNEEDLIDNCYHTEFVPTLEQQFSKQVLPAVIRSARQRKKDIESACAALETRLSLKIQMALSELKPLASCATTSGLGNILRIPQREITLLDFIPDNIPNVGYDGLQWYGIPTPGLRLETSLPTLSEHRKAKRSRLKGSSQTGTDTTGSSAAAVKPWMDNWRASTWARRIGDNHRILSGLIVLLTILCHLYANGPPNIK